MHSNIHCQSADIIQWKVCLKKRLEFDFLELELESLLNNKLRGKIGYKETERKKD